ncbi:MAG: hypothetical protein ACREIV_15990 [Planctomycetaceae bacterium]
MQQPALRGPGGSGETMGHRIEGMVQHALDCAANYWQLRTMGQATPEDLLAVRQALAEATAVAGNDEVSLLILRSITGSLNEIDPDSAPEAEEVAEEKPVVHELCPYCGEPQAQRLLNNAVRVRHECARAPRGQPHLRRTWQGDQILFVPAARWIDRLPDAPGLWIVRWTNGAEAAAEVSYAGNGEATSDLRVSYRGITVPVDQLEDEYNVDCCYGPMPQPVRT